MKIPLLLCTTLLVMVMTGLAGAFHQNAIIFPEIAALTFGAWAMRARPWMATNISLWLSPTLAALTGVIIFHYGPESFLLKIMIAFLCVLAELWIMRSALLPSISAAVLPLVTGDATWMYPVAVGLFMGIVAWGCFMLDRFGNGNYRQETLKRRGGVLPWPESLFSLLRWGKILALIIVVAGLSQLLGWPFVIAPPLIIACIEFVNPGSKLQRRPLRLFWLIVLSASTGALFVFLASNGSMPFWCAAGLATAVVYVLYWRLALPCPPAIALAVLPTIVPPALLPVYPLHIAVGCVVFFMGGKLLFRSEA